MTKINSYISRKKAKDELINIKTREKGYIDEINSLKSALLIKNQTEHHTNYKKFEIPSDNRHKNEIIPISLFSDAHIEERITLQSTNGLNEYNPDIAEARIKMYFNNLLKIIRVERNNSNVNKLVLCLLGDTITGYIHEELMEDNYMSPTQAIIFAQKLLIKGIKLLSEDGDFKNITIIMKSGNHGRLSKRKKYSTGYKNNLESLMYSNIINAFTLNGNYNNLNFILEENNITYLTLFDKYVIRCSHGDHFNYRGGIAGVEIPFKTWLYKINESIKADLTCIGHWHRHAIIGDGIINGSIKGFDSFAVEHGFRYQPPTQHLQLLDRNRGFTTNYKIFLD